MQTQASFTLEAYNVRVFVDITVEPSRYDWRSGVGEPGYTSVDAYEIEVLDVHGKTVELASDLHLLIKEKLEDQIMERALEVANEVC